MPEKEIGWSEAAEGPGKSGAKKHQPRKQDKPRGKRQERGGGKIRVCPFLLFLGKVLRRQKRPAQTRDRIDHGGHEHDRRAEIDDGEGILVKSRPTIRLSANSLRDTPTADSSAGII